MSPPHSFPASSKDVQSRHFSLTASRTAMATGIHGIKFITFPPCTDRLKTDQRATLWETAGYPGTAAKTQRDFAENAHLAKPAIRRHFHTVSPRCLWMRASCRMANMEGANSAISLMTLLPLPGSRVWMDMVCMPMP